jgi:hypothetical protein
MKPIPVGTLVDYHGSHKHGRYVVIAHRCPQDMFPKDEWGDDMAQYYPDGVAYEIYPEDLPRKFGLVRDYTIWRVRRSSLTIALCTREGFEPMEPFAEKPQASPPEEI